MSPRGGKRPGAGRPPGSGSGTEYTATLSIKCTPEQRERWKAAAGEQGRSLADWVRRLLDVHTGAYRVDEDLWEAFVIAMEKS